MNKPMRRFPAFFPALLLAGAAFAQDQRPAPPAAADEMRRLCATISMSPADGREMARRAECVLSGVLPSPDRIGEARTYARAALNSGEPSGGLMLYLAFQHDPTYQYVRDGKVDAAAYRRLAARSVEQRKDQIDAIEGLGFAVGKGHPGAGVLLAAYFHDTVAPRNVQRLGALTALLMRNGDRNPAIERFAQEADVIARNAAATKASPRSFFEAYHDASVAAAAGYREQSQGKSCDDVKLKSVSASEIEDAEYLPLKGTVVAESYLVKGRWSEYWTFQACGEEVPVQVTFAADGWGGSTSRAAYNKGS
jgi:hypothetical protein